MGILIDIPPLLSLRELSLEENAITSWGELSPLAKLTKLEVLNLNGNAIEVRSIHQVMQDERADELTKLEVLSLCRSIMICMSALMSSCRGAFQLIFSGGHSVCG